MGNLLEETPRSKITASLKEVLDHRVTSQRLARLRTDKNYARRVAELMLCGDIDSSINHKLARAVMSQNFFGFGIEEWTALYGANFSKKQLREVNEFPWGEDILAYRKTGVYLNPNVYARVSNTMSSGRRVCIGYFFGDRLSVYDWNSRGYSNVGLSASRKLPRILNA